MSKLRLPSFGHILRRQDSLGETIMLGKVEGSRKRGRPNTRWAGSLKEATTLSLQELIRAAEDRTCWRSLSHRVTIYQSQLDDM